HLTISDDINLLVLSTRHFYSNAVTTRLNLKSYYDIDGNINLPDHKRVVYQIESLHCITNNLSIIAQVQSRLAEQSIEKLYKLIQEARTYNKETVLAKLWDWVKKMFSLPFESWKSALFICHLRKDIQGIIRVLKTDFPELRIKKYYGKSDSVERLKILAINKNVLTVRLWVAYMLEVSLSIIKAEEIADVSNATIINRETAEFLENKPKKTLEEMQSLDWNHIVDFYEILPESLTEDFILKYGNFNHIKWFRAYRQL
ncbi:15011_t:CDS:2, partial [Funneliformis geosporum]